MLARLCVLGFSFPDEMQASALAFSNRNSGKGTSSTRAALAVCGPALATAGLSPQTQPSVAKASPECDGLRHDWKVVPFPNGGTKRLIPGSITPFDVFLPKGCVREGHEFDSCRFTLYATAA